MSRAQRYHTQPGITPRREGPERGTGDRFLIVVEGKETERRYLEDLCGKLMFSAAKVIIKSPDSDPLNMVNEALKLRDAEAKLAEKRQTVNYDQVWVVCDRETKNHHRSGRLREACEKAQENSIHLALSIPSFEYWLLLHHGYSKAALPDCPAAESALSKIQTNNGHPKYDKSTYPLEFYITAKEVTSACDYADRIRKDHESSDTMIPSRYWAKDYVLRPAGANAPDGNPCTDVDELIRQLNLAANPDFRYVLFTKLTPAPFAPR